MVHTTSSKPPVGYTPQPDDIVFTQADASWVHNPHEDALVITAEVSNRLVHRLLVDSGSAVNILYWGAYQKTGLRRADLTPTTSPLYEFIKDSVILEGTMKLVVTLSGDRLPRSEIPISLQWSAEKTITKGLKSNEVNSLLDNKVPYSSRDRPSSRKTM